MPWIRDTDRLQAQSLLKGSESSSSSTFSNQNSRTMWPAIISAAGSLLGSLVGGASTNEANKRNVALQRETNELNYRMNKENNEYNRNLAIEMFNLENEYNSPGNMRKRLEAAGINPFVAAANQMGIVEGRAETPMAQQPIAAQSAQVSPLFPQQSLVGTFSEVANAFNSLASAKKTGIESDLLDETFDDVVRQYKANADLTSAQVRSQILDNAIKALYGFKKARKEVEELESNIIKLQQETDESRSRQLLNLVEAGLKRVQTRLTRQQLNQFMKLQPIVIKTAQLERDNKIKEGKEIDSRTSANYAAAEASRASAAYGYAAANKTLSEKKFIDMQNKLTERVYNLRHIFADTIEQLYDPSMSVSRRNSLLKNADRFLNQLQALVPEYRKLYAEGSYAADQIGLLEQYIIQAKNTNNWFYFDKAMQVVSAVTGIANAASKFVPK